MDFSSIPKTVKDIYEKHEIHWIVDDQEPKKMELIDLVSKNEKCCIPVPKIHKKYPCLITPYFDEATQIFSFFF